MKDINSMTIVELRDYTNTLSNEEIGQALLEFDHPAFEEDFDLLSLLKAPKLYDYLQYEHKGNAKVEL